MKESNTIITDWLDKYGCPEIDSQVEREIEKINLIGPLKARIKKLLQKQ